MTMPPTPPNWTVIMPVYNGIGFLERSLPPLIAAANKHGAELILVDDGSTDATADYVTSLAPGLKLLTSGGTALGPAQARNVGAQAAQGDLLLFVDADVIIHDNVFELFEEVLANESLSGAFGAYDTAPPERGYPSLYMNLRHHAYHQVPTQNAGTFWSGLGAIRREAFLGVEGFDVEAYPRPSIEDIDLGMRLTNEFGPLARDPRIMGKHLKHWSVRGILHTDIFCRALPWSKLMVRNPGAFGDMNVSKSEQARALLAGVLLLSIAAAVLSLAPWWLPLVVFEIAFLTNRKLFQVFRCGGGLPFAVAALAFHQVYYLYGAAVFVFCRLTVKPAPQHSTQGASE
ncbi:MAG: glycosyltransferase involved in cell wall biosynthesis [Planctomycetota bacterium]|jgi:glycosyltransferase involved in cell wall biosynthesis